MAEREGGEVMEDQMPNEIWGLLKKSGKIEIVYADPTPMMGFMKDVVEVRKYVCDPPKD